MREDGPVDSLTLKYKCFMETIISISILRYIENVPALLGRKDVPMINNVDALVFSILSNVLRYIDNNSNLSDSILKMWAGLNTDILDRSTRIYTNNLMQGILVHVAKLLRPSTRVRAIWTSLEKKKLTRVH